MAPSSSGASESAGKAAVDVGHIFAQGGTDGLILYALLLGTFLMFLLGVITIFLLLRALSTKDRACADQSARFAEAASDSSEAMRQLAESVATKNATDIAHHTALTSLMARLEGVLGRIDPRNEA